MLVSPSVDPSGRSVRTVSRTPFLRISSQTGSLETLDVLIRAVVQARVGFVFIMVLFFSFSTYQMSANAHDERYRSFES